MLKHKDLDLDDISAIRYDYMHTDKNIRQLSEEYNLSYWVCYKIIANLSFYSTGWIRPIIKPRLKPYLKTIHRLKNNGWSWNAIAKKITVGDCYHFNPISIKQAYKRSLNNGKNQG